MNDKLYKQIDGCPMGSSISVVMAGIFMAKLERDVIKPPYPIFYQRYVDDTYVRKKKNVPDELFEKLNNYHENINFTKEPNPTKFLDTKISFDGSQIITAVVTKDNKLPPHWSSKTPKRYKRNIINGELHRAKKISSDFSKEIIRIRNKFKHAGYPIRFINSVINEFGKPKVIHSEPGEPKRRITVNLPFCADNEEFSKRFIKRLNNYTHDKYSFIVIWKTRKIRTLFPLKDRVVHVSDVIYEGICTCENNYIGETDRISGCRWNEHEDVKRNSEPAKHLKQNPTHKFKWKILTKAPKDKYKRRILETFFIKTMKPTLNNQIQNYPLKLFHNGIT